MKAIHEAFKRAKTLRKQSSQMTALRPTAKIALAEQALDETETVIGQLILEVEAQRLEIEALRHGQN